MKLVRVLFKRETAVPMLALLLASVVSLGLILGRVAWTRDFRYGSLAWNLFLAWLPLLFALLARDAFRQGQRPTWRFYGLAGVWLLFFPNAPYIFTDLIHLWTRGYGRFWTDLTLILLCALTGLVLGFVSLYLMQSVVARMFGRAASWLFVALAAGLCSFGVYLGRFLRFNSWDLFLKPRRLYHGVDTWMDRTPLNHTSVAFLVLFATFIFVTYVMLYALTHLPRAEEMQSPLGEGVLRNA